MLPVPRTDDTQNLARTLLEKGTKNLLGKANVFLCYCNAMLEEASTLKCNNAFDSNLSIIVGR